MQAGDVHQLRVFVGDGALGNTTGVVGIGAGERREAMAERARLLGYPDTAFVSVGESGVSVDSFSPFEEMRFCTQTLLATEAVLRAAGTISPGEPLLTRTPAGTVRVSELARQASELVQGIRRAVCGADVGSERLAMLGEVEVDAWRNRVVCATQQAVDECRGGTAQRVI
jgi:predicted PhzF superfamily epimerase YddE/YHI9